MRAAAGPSQRHQPQCAYFAGCDKFGHAAFDWAPCPCTVCICCASCARGTAWLHCGHMVRKVDAGVLQCTVVGVAEHRMRRLKFCRTGDSRDVLKPHDPQKQAQRTRTEGARNRQMCSTNAHKRQRERAPWELAMPQPTTVKYALQRAQETERARTLGASHASTHNRQMCSTTRTRDKRECAYWELAVPQPAGGPPAGLVRMTSTRRGSPLSVGCEARLSLCA